MASFIKITLTLIMVVASAFIMIYVVENFYETKDKPEMILSVRPSSNRAEDLPNNESDPSQKSIVGKMKKLFSDSTQPQKTEEEQVDFKDLQVDSDVHHGLSVAAMTGDVAELEKLLKAGISPDVKDSFGIRAIARATLWGHYDAVEMLLQYGASVNRQERLGVTLLMLAANQGDEKLVKLFLKYKADPNLRSEDGETALTTASKKGYFSIADILRKAGGDEKITLENIVEDQAAEVKTEMKTVRVEQPKAIEKTMTVESEQKQIERIEVKPFENRMIPKESVDSINMADVPMMAMAQSTIAEPSTTPSLAALTWAANISKESIEMIELDTFVDEKPAEKKTTQAAAPKKIKIMKEQRPAIPIEREATIGGRPIENPSQEKLEKIDSPIEKEKWKKRDDLQGTASATPVMSGESQTLFKFDTKVSRATTLNQKRIDVQKIEKPLEKRFFQSDQAVQIINSHEVINVKEAQLVSPSPSVTETSFQTDLRATDIQSVEDKLRNKLPTEAELDQIWNEISRIKINDDVDQKKAKIPTKNFKMNVVNDLPSQRPILTPAASNTLLDQSHTAIEPSEILESQSAQQILKMIEQSERELNKMTGEISVSNNMWSAEDFNDDRNVSTVEAYSLPLPQVNQYNHTSVYTVDDLFKAVLADTPTQLIQVIDDGVDVDARGALEMTPLMVAAQDGRIEIVKILLENGAKINATNIVGQTPIKLASLREHQDVISLLKQYEARDVIAR